jgi:prefoldin subunit 5
MERPYSVIASIAVGIVIVLAVAVAFNDTNSSLSSLSSQNAGLKGQITSLNQQVISVYQQESSLSEQNSNLGSQVTGLNQQNVGLNQQLSNLEQQVSTLEQRTLTVVTVSNTVFMVETTTSVTTATSIHTSTVYPVPDNVTILFTKVSGGYSYTITAGSTSYTGSDDSQLSVPITPVFQGETIAISVSLTGLMGCSMGQTVTAELYLNSQVVAQGTEICTGSNIQITYTI